MIKLTDEELDQVYHCAAPLPVADRDRYLRTVADKLAASPMIGPGVVHRCCREAQRELMQYPDLERRGTRT
jgi:hypothetical protein